MANLHFAITTSGIVAILAFVIVNAYRLGGILQKINSHLDESNKIHEGMINRIQWLERNRR